MSVSTRLAACLSGGRRTIAALSIVTLPIVTLPIASLAFASLALVSLSACAPARTNSTYSGADLGRTARISYGTIVSMRGVTVQGQPSGLGTLGGAAAGGAAGSFIGGPDIRGNIIGAIGGALIGGLVGSVTEGALSQADAVEFIIQEDNVPAPISVVQANEDGFHPGERVVLSRGARTRLAHAAPVLGS